jgi:tRNA wybutosine-synthesizing protein 1
MKIDNKMVKEFEKQGYRFTGKNSAVKICNWTRKSLRNEGVCYKQKFYGINSHRCAQISCSLVNCQNRCLHCWRNLDYTSDCAEIIFDKPLDIINNTIREQQKILKGFGGNKKADKKKYKEAMQPLHFAISLVGEPTLYPRLAELIVELRKQKKTSFLVTNGLLPEALKKLEKQKALPSQLYLSLNYPNENLFRKITQNKSRNAWKKFNESLSLMKKLKTRRVLRMTLVRNLNLGFEEEYAELKKKAMPDFVECKGYVSVGFARKRLGYERMPDLEEIRKFSTNLLKYLKGYKKLGEHDYSKIVLLGRDKRKMKIRPEEI